MLMLKQIREDLREIRYYYSRKALFDEALKLITANAVLEKARRYSEAVKTAPPWLFDLYISLYIKNYTQEGLSIELNFTPEYIQMQHKKLLLFLQSKING